MFKRGLFRKYFFICSFCVVSSLVVLGAVLLVCATSFFEHDRYDMLTRNAARAAAITAGSYSSSGGNSLDATTIMLTYSIFSNSIGAEFFLVQMDGRILYYDNSKGADLSATVLPQELVAQAANGGYSATGPLPGVYQKPHYIVGVPVTADGSAIAVLFAASPADDLMDFLKEISQMFLISTAVVLILAFVLIFFLTSQMVRPLKQMLEATQSFSKGDFSKRVPVSGYDEIGQLSMAFNNMASTLAVNESTRRAFVANISHELKTPMTTIAGFVDGILDGTVPEEKREQYLQVVSNEVGRLSRLVRSMLDTARIEAGEMEIRPSVFDISETIRQTIFTFEQGIEDKRLEIRGLEEDRIMVYADQDLMHQVVYNLIENAVKFVNPEGYIAISYRQEDHRTYVAIRNSGGGISKEEAPMLFDRFYKSDRSRGLNKNGVGLGLHIVRSIINHHRGEIVVRSAEGQYAEFEFYIPSAPKA